VISLTRPNFGETRAPASQNATSHLGLGRFTPMIRAAISRCSYLSLLICCEMIKVKLSADQMHDLSYIPSQFSASGFVPLHLQLYPILWRGPVCQSFVIIYLFTGHNVFPIEPRRTIAPLPSGWGKRKRRQKFWFCGDPPRDSLFLCTSGMMGNVVKNGGKLSFITTQTKIANF